MPQPPLHRPPRRAVRTALTVALALLAPAAARAQAEGCRAAMRALPGGRFTLADGSQVAEVGALCLDEAEVTAAAYAACVRRGACQEAGLRCGKAATYGARGKEDHPVNCVTWHDADGFCRAQGKRLPTEAEWEWAARGRLRATPYPWGSTPPAERACWDGAGSTLGKGGRNETCATGAFPAGDSPDGLHDLGGNLREWTSSRVGRDRVVRGGSWGDSLPEFLAAGFRGMNAADERFEITGFRCAATPGVLAEPRAAPATTAEELAEEGGLVVAPLEPDPPPAPPPPVKVARPAPAPASAPAPAPRSGPRQQVEFGEIKIESLSGSR